MREFFHVFSKWLHETTRLCTWSISGFYITTYMYMPELRIVHAKLLRRLCTLNQQLSLNLVCRNRKTLNLTARPQFQGANQNSNKRSVKIPSLSHQFPVERRKYSEVSLVSIYPGKLTWKWSKTTI